MIWLLVHAIPGEPPAHRRNETSQVLLMVPTNVADLERRAVMRSSWMRRMHDLDDVFVTVRFAVGVPPPNWRHQWLSWAFTTEQREFHDLVQLGYDDSEDATSDEQLDAQKVHAALLWAFGEGAKSDGIRHFDYFALLSTNTYVNWPKLAPLLPRPAPHAPHAVDSAGRRDSAVAPSAKVELRGGLEPGKLLYFGKEQRVSLQRLRGAGGSSGQGSGPCNKGQSAEVRARYGCSSTVSCAADGLTLLSRGAALWLSKIPRTLWRGPASETLCGYLLSSELPIAPLLLNPAELHASLAWVHGPQLNDADIYYSCHIHSCAGDGDQIFIVGYHNVNQARMPYRTHGKPRSAHTAFYKKTYPWLHRDQSGLQTAIDDGIDHTPKPPR